MAKEDWKKLGYANTEDSRIATEKSPEKQKPCLSFFGQFPVLDIVLQDGTARQTSCTEMYRTC